jgi:hypothetical protein
MEQHSRCPVPWWQRPVPGLSAATAALEMTREVILLNLLLSPE